MRLYFRSGKRASPSADERTREEWGGLRHTCGAFLAPSSPQKHGVDRERATLGEGRLQHGKTPIDPFPRTWGHTTCALERGSQPTPSCKRAIVEGGMIVLIFETNFEGGGGRGYIRFEGSKGSKLHFEILEILEWFELEIGNWNIGKICLSEIEDSCARLTLQGGELKKKKNRMFISNFKSHHPVLPSTFHIWGRRRRRRKGKEKGKKSTRLKLKITRYLSNYT